ncbi:hypothetical protein EV714DRAFT_222641, partial [Schizophyllum commune]
CCTPHDAHNAMTSTSRSPQKAILLPSPPPLHRDARPVLSTARSSTHRTGEFAVLGSARDASFDVPRHPRPG